MKEINCLGELCPIPILKIKKALNQMNTNDRLKVITDHSCVHQSILNHYKSNIIDIDEVLNGVWEIIIIKS